MFLNDCAVGKNIQQDGATLSGKSWVSINGFYPKLKQVGRANPKISFYIRINLRRASLH